MNCSSRSVLSSLPLKKGNFFKCHDPKTSSGHLMWLVEQCWDFAVLVPVHSRLEHVSGAKRSVAWVLKSEMFQWRSAQRKTWSGAADERLKRSPSVFLLACHSLTLKTRCFGFDLELLLPWEIRSFEYWFCYYYEISQIQEGNRTWKLPKKKRERLTILENYEKY